MSEIHVKRKCPNCGASVHGKSEIFAKAVCCPKCRKRAIFEEVSNPKTHKLSELPERAEAQKSSAECHWSPRKRLALIYTILVICFFLPQYGIAWRISAFAINMGALYGWSTYIGIFIEVLAFAGLLLTAIKRGKCHTSFSEKILHLTILMAVCGTSIFGIILGLSGSYMLTLRSILGDLIYYPYATFLITCLSSIGFVFTLGWDTTANGRRYAAVAYETICTRLPYLNRLRAVALGWCLPLIGWLILLWFNPNHGTDELRKLLLIEAGVLVVCGLATLAIAFWRRTGAGISVLAVAICFGAGGLSGVLAGGLAASFPYYRIKQEQSAFQEKIRIEAAAYPSDVTFRFLAAGHKSGKLIFTYDKSSETFCRLTIELDATPAKEVFSTGRAFRVSGADLGGTGKFAHSTVIFDPSSMPLPKGSIGLYDAIICSGKLRIYKDNDYKRVCVDIKVELPESFTTNTKYELAGDNVWRWDPLVFFSGTLGKTSDTDLDFTFLDSQEIWNYECLGEIRGQVLSLTVLATINKKRYTPMRLECIRGRNLSAEIFVNGAKIQQNPFIKTYNGVPDFRMPPFASAAAKIALPNNEAVTEVRLRFYAGPFGGIQDLKAILNTGKGF